MAKLFWTLPISGGRHLTRFTIAVLICIGLLLGFFSSLSTNVYLYYLLGQQQQRCVPAAVYNKRLSTQLILPDDLRTVAVGGQSSQRFQIVSLNSLTVHIAGLWGHLYAYEESAHRFFPTLNAAPSDVWKPSPLEAKLLAYKISASSLVHYTNIDPMELGGNDPPHLVPEARPPINQQSPPEDSPDGPRCKDRQLKSPLGADDSKNISCQVEGCGKTFASQHEYNHHMRYHTKPKKCPSCLRSFGTITHLKRHINDTHENSQKHYCDVVHCPYSRNGPQQKFFSRKDNWKRHMQDKHKMGGKGGPNHT